MSTTGAAATSTRRASGWIALLVLFGIASTVEAFSVSHVFRFLPLYLGTVQVPPSEVPAWTGYLNAAFFLFGLPLVPFWGVWAERYGRIPIIARSAFVEMVVFAVLWLAQNRWEAAFGLLLVGFQLGNTGVMLTALRAVAPPGRVGFAISLFGITPSLGFALGPVTGGWLVAHNVLNLHTLFALDAALSLAAASLAELALAPDLLWLTVGAVALGAATATAISMVFSLLATGVPEERRATTLNLVLLPIYFSSIAGGVVGALLVREGLNTVLWAAAAVSMIAALLTTRLPSPARAGAGPGES